MLPLSQILFNSVLVQIMLSAIIACSGYVVFKHVMKPMEAAALVEPVMPGAGPYASDIACDDDDHSLTSTTASPSHSPSPTSSLPSLVSDDDASLPSSAASSPLTPSNVVDHILVSTIKTAGHAGAPVAAKPASFYGALGLDIASFDLAPRRKPSPRTLLIGRTIEKDVGQSGSLGAAVQRRHPYQHQRAYHLQQWARPTRLLDDHNMSTNTTANTSTSASSADSPRDDVDQALTVIQQEEGRTIDEPSAQQAVQSYPTPAVSDAVSALVQSSITSNPVAFPVGAPFSSYVQHSAPANGFASEIAPTTNAEVAVRHPDTDDMDVDLRLLPRHTRRRRHARAPALVHSLVGTQFEAPSNSMADMAIIPTSLHLPTVPFFNINLTDIRAWQFGFYVVVLQDTDEDVDMDAGVQASTEDGSAPMDLDSQPIPALTNGLALPLPAPAPPAQQPSATVPKTSSGPAPRPSSGQNVTKQATAQAKAASAKGKAAEKTSGKDVQSNKGLALPRSSADVVKHHAARSSAIPTSTSGSAPVSLTNAAAATASSKRTESMLKYVLLKGKADLATSQTTAARPSVAIQPSRAASSANGAASASISKPTPTRVPSPAAMPAPIVNRSAPVPGKLTKAQREEQERVKAACNAIIADACGKTPTATKAGVTRR